MPSKDVAKELSRRFCDPSHLTRMACCLPLAILTSAVVAKPSVCWVDNVIRIGQDVELQFVADGGVLVRIQEAGKEMAPTDRVYREIGDRMHRLYPGAMQPEAVVSKVILSDGEAAWVSTGLHGACTLTPTHKGASLGVMATATMSMGGLPPQVTSQFIAAGEGRDVTP